MSKKFNILSIDGGGLRGIIPVMILQELEKRTGKHIYEMFDLIAGTSTGGLLACGLTAPNELGEPNPNQNGKAFYSIQDLEDIYINDGKRIFPERKGLGKVLNTISSLFGPSFSDKGISDVLYGLLANDNMLSCIKPIFVTSWDINNNEAVIFKSRYAKTPGCNADLYDICRATSAAPTYLPAYSMKYNNKDRILIDGGIYMCNPTIGAIVEILKWHSDPYYNRVDLQQEDICVLSLGTGEYTENVSQDKNGGILSWAKPITEVMMQAQSQTVDYQANELIEDGQYLRLNLKIGDSTHADMADSSDATRNYLIDQCNKQILNNKTLMDSLDLFIKKAEL